MSGEGANADGREERPPPRLTGEDSSQTKLSDYQDWRKHGRPRRGPIELLHLRIVTADCCAPEPMNFGRGHRVELTAFYETMGRGMLCIAVEGVQDFVFVIYRCTWKKHPRTTSEVHR